MYAAVNVSCVAGGNMACHTRSYNKGVQLPYGFYPAHSNPQPIMMMWAGRGESMVTSWIQDIVGQPFSHQAQNEVQKLLSHSEVTIVVRSLWGHVVGTSLAWSATDGHVSSPSFLVSFVAVWFCLPHIWYFISLTPRTCHVWTVPYVIVCVHQHQNDVGKCSVSLHAVWGVKSTLLDHN